MSTKFTASLSPSPSTSTKASIERKTIKISKRMNAYVFNESYSNLLIKGSIASLSINGSNNKILIRSSVPTLIINGEGNSIKATYYQNSLCDIIFNNDNNKIKIAKGSSYINKIDNGNHNKIYSAIKEKKLIENQTKEVQKVENETNIHISFSIDIDINEIFSLFTGSKRKRENEY